MRIGLIDVDNWERLGNCFPNLVLMKLSAWHKTKGDEVEWYQPLFSGHLDRVYMSKVFSFSPDYPYYIDADEVVGGVLDIASIWRTERKSLTSRRIQFSPTRLSISCRTIRYTESQTQHSDSCRGDAPGDAISVS